MILFPTPSYWEGIAQRELQPRFAPMPLFAQNWLIFWNAFNKLEG